MRNFQKNWKSVICSRQRKPDHCLVEMNQNERYLTYSNMIISIQYMGLVLMFKTIDIHCPALQQQLNYTFVAFQLWRQASKWDAMPVTDQAGYEMFVYHRGSLFCDKWSHARGGPLASMGAWHVWDVSTPRRCNEARGLQDQLMKRNRFDLILNHSNRARIRGSHWERLKQWALWKVARESLIVIDILNSQNRCRVQWTSRWWWGWENVQAKTGVWLIHVQNIYCEFSTLEEPKNQ